MNSVKLLKFDGKPNVARPDYILNFKVSEFDCESTIFYYFSVFLGSLLRKFTIFGPRADDFARSEDKSGRLRVSESHDNRCESLGVVLGIPALKGDSFEVQGTLQIQSGHHISKI